MRITNSESMRTYYAEHVIFLIKKASNSFHSFRIGAMCFDHSDINRSEQPAEHFSIQFYE